MKYIRITDDGNHTLTNKTGVNHHFGHILISNNHATQDSKCALFLDDGSTTYFFFKGLIIPASTTFVFDESYTYDNRKYILYLNTLDGDSGNSTDLTVVLKS
jgi:hypothetical protein